MKKNKNLIQSFNNAINGILQAIKTERNMKIHISAAVIVLILSMIYGLNKMEFLIVCLAVGLVIICELFNTAIEVMVDIIVDIYHPKAKIIKDVAAGAVLVSAFVSMVVAYFLFFERVSNAFQQGIIWVKQAPIHITVISIIITIILVLGIKALIQKGTPFSGGMPSGHSAVAFAITTGISIWTGNAAIAALCLILSLLLVQSRLEGKIHNLLELVAGAVLGCLTTFLLFQIFYW